MIFPWIAGGNSPGMEPRGDDSVPLAAPLAALLGERSVRLRWL